LVCESDGSYVLHGITSFVSAEGCALSGIPSAFTRVSYYADWINSTIYGE